MRIFPNHPEGRLARVAPWASLAVVAVVLPIALAGCSTSEHPTVANTYGGMPSYLSGIEQRSDKVLTGTTKRPALTSEGDTVRMRLADGATVLATVTGPVVPGEGLPHQDETTTCTWTVDLHGATARIPIDLSDLTTIDQQGSVYRLTPVPGRPAPPTGIAPGEHRTFELRTVMKVGEGIMRWAPGGSGVVAQWDFEVEND